MFVQTEITPNPNSLKFLPGKIVSNHGSFEITKKDQSNNELVNSLLSVNGVEGIFLGKDFISINKYNDIPWDEIKHIVISLINDFYSSGKEWISAINQLDLFQTSSEDTNSNFFPKPRELSINLIAWGKSINQKWVYQT